MPEPFWGNDDAGWESRGHTAPWGVPEAVMAEEESPHDFKADYYEKCSDYMKDPKYVHHFTREQLAEAIEQLDGVTADEVGLHSLLSVGAIHLVCPHTVLRIRAQQAPLLLFRAAPKPANQAAAS